MVAGAVVSAVPGDGVFRVIVAATGANADPRPSVNLTWTVFGPSPELRVQDLVVANFSGALKFTPSLENCMVPTPAEDFAARVRVTSGVLVCCAPALIIML